MSLSAGVGRGQVRRGGGICPPGPATFNYNILNLCSYLFKWYINVGCFIRSFEYLNHLWYHTHTHTYACIYKMNKTMCLRGSHGVGRGLPVGWITLYMWGQYVLCLSVCVRGWGGGCYESSYTPILPAPPSKKLYKADGGKRHLCHLAFRHRDNHTLTGHRNSSGTYRSSWDNRDLRVHFIGLCPAGCWPSELKQGQTDRHSISRQPTAKTLQTFVKLTPKECFKKQKPAEPWRSSTCCTCCCCS